MNTKKISFLYTCLQGLYWSIYCLCYSFAAIYFLANGISSEWIGVILAGANICAVGLQLLLDRLLANSRKLGLRNVLCFGVLLLIVTQGLAALIPSQTFLAAGLFAAGLATILTLQPFANSLGFHYANEGFTLNFGFSRGIGSLSFAVISYLMGELLTIQEPSIIPIFIAGLSGLLLLVLFFLPLDTPGIPEDKESGGKLKAVLAKYHFLPYAALGTLFLFMFHNGLFGFMAQFMGGIGGDSRDVGIALMLTAMCELPAMFLFERLLKWRRGNFWLTLAAGVYVVRSLLTLLAASVISFEVVQFLQAISFALYIPASSYVINAALEPQDRTFGQTIIVVAMTIGGILGTLTTGWLIDNLGTKAALLFLSGATILGFLCILISSRQAIRQEKG